METQKKSGTELTFDFGEESLAYRLKDSNGTQTLTVDYADVKFSPLDEFVEKNDWFKYVGIVWLVIGGAESVMAGRLSVWAIVGAIMLATHFFRIVRYSVLHSSEGRILVIRGAKHDTIIETIRANKRRVLREKLFFANAANPPERELAKYRYLRDEGAITNEEFEQASTALLAREGVTESAE
jgi:hypothetical protein